jgi:hypothetical protein
MLKRIIRLSQECKLKCANKNIPANAGYYWIEFVLGRMKIGLLYDEQKGCENLHISCIRP